MRYALQQWRIARTHMPPTLQSHDPLPEQVPQEIPIPSAPDSVGRSLLVMTRRGCSVALPVSVTISAVTGVRPSPP